MTSIAAARHRWDGKVECRFPYDRDLVDSLKALIPSSHREWVPESKVWLIGPAYGPVAIRLMRDTFGEVVIEDTRQTYRDPFQASSTPAIDPDCKALFVLPNAPRCVVDAAYKALSKELHPDRGGDVVAMQALNSAYERVRDRLVS